MVLLPRLVISCLIAKNVETAGTFFSGKFNTLFYRISLVASWNPPSIVWPKNCARCPFRVDRFLKTGTPPRIDARSVDFLKCKQQTRRWTLRPLCVTWEIELSSGSSNEFLLPIRMSELTNIIRAVWIGLLCIPRVIEGVGPRYLSFY